MYLGFENTPDYSNWLWCRNKKKAYNFETLRELYNQLLQVPYHGVDSEDDPVNYCKIVKVQVSDLMRSLNMLENDMKAVGAIKTETVINSELDKTVIRLYLRHADSFKTGYPLKANRDYFADILRRDVPDISEEEVNHYVHKHLPERNA